MNNESIVDTDYYDEILHYFNKNPQKIELEIWKNQEYIKLMKVLKKTENKQQIRNSIILLLMLFEDLPPDLLNARGNELKNLKPEEKNKLISLLKKEYSSSSNS